MDERKILPRLSRNMFESSFFDLSSLDCSFDLSSFVEDEELNDVSVVVEFVAAAEAVEKNFGLSAGEILHTNWLLVLVLCGRRVTEVVVVHAQ